MSDIRLTSTASPLIGGLAGLGRGVLSLLRLLGGLIGFAMRAGWAVLTPPWFPGPFGRQLLAIGYFSLPVVG